MRAGLRIEFCNSSRDMIPEGMTGFINNYMMTAAKDFTIMNPLNHAATYFTSELRSPIHIVNAINYN